MVGVSIVVDWEKGINGRLMGVGGLCYNNCMVYSFRSKNRTSAINK